jgi:hypothetical protein
VLLPGGGDTAHVFDDFAPKLATISMSTASRAAVSASLALRRSPRAQTRSATTCSRCSTRSSWRARYSSGTQSAGKS